MKGIDLSNMVSVVLLAAAGAAIWSWQSPALTRCFVGQDRSPEATTDAGET